MTRYIIRRVLGMIPTLIIISIISFILIQLPPGDIITSTLRELEQQGQPVSEEKIAALRAMYHLDDPMPVQYLRWIGGFLQGNMGYSIRYQQPVNRLVMERLGLTVLIAVASILFTWVLAMPAGIYSAVKQYSITDYTLTVLAFLGMATPSFVLALIMMYLGYEWFGISVGGLFSPEFVGAPWSLDRVTDLLKHIWVPMVILGLGGTAGMIRVLRANLLDELKKPYVVTARAKGLHPIRVILKYPVRIAISPFISTIGWMLPGLFSGSAIISVVLDLPTTGPLLLEALMSQDMYLAGSFIMVLSTLTVIGTLISDLLLVVVDPRIKYE
ncbi:MAG TPA: ABC transporter permease [candidate division Zixibacteria bacterium]|jgi:peptide/nickel transport system permease protein|nr:ABC transporter permease [Gemmatimonadota bacterium]HIG47746.1 ABC transporter permease [candidate division Zixibacteria bacterium]